MNARDRSTVEYKRRPLYAAYHRGERRSACNVRGHAGFIPTAVAAETWSRASPCAVEHVQAEE